MPLFQGGRSTSISFGESGTASVIAQAARGEEPGYLARLIVEAEPAPRTRMRAALRGDCHTHSDWSDGGSPPREMAEAARDLGHEWIALTDHSPRLSSRRTHARAAGGTTRPCGPAERRTRPFRILTGEVDILEDGTLDQRDDLLGELDVVLASVHSKLRMAAEEMTSRMLTAVSSPHVDVLGHW